MKNLTSYKNLHLWMIIPMLIMQIGIFEDYWGDFVENDWSVHVHYWTGTIWYFFLISQPYFATHNQMERHRSYGMIGLVLAGGVVFSALGMMYDSIHLAHLAQEYPAEFDPFEDWFFYGVGFIEIIIMLLFLFAVIQSVRFRKRLLDHAWWLCSTVFVIMMPALARGIQNTWLRLDTYVDLIPMGSMYLTTFLIVVMILLAAYKFGKINHPATWLAIFGNILCCFLDVFGKSIWMQQTMEKLIVG